MRKKRWENLLFADNAPSHSKDIILSNVKVKFLPANTTSILQPLDQGIIRAFKARYRKHLLRSLLSQMETVSNATELCKSITVLDAIRWIDRAWGETTETTIVKCFRDPGFPVIDLGVPPIEEFDDEDLLPLATLISSVCATDSCSVEDMLSIESGVPTEDISDTNWETALISEHHDSLKDTTTAEESDPSDNECDQEPEAEPDVTYTDILKMAKTMQRFAITKDSRFKNISDELEHLAETVIIENKCVKRQSNITNFFV